MMIKNSEQEPTICSEKIKPFLINKFLIFGFLFGICIAEIFSFSDLSTYLYIRDRYNTEYRYSRDYQDVNEIQDEDIDPLRGIGSHVHADENSLVADKLFKEIRVLCFITTCPRNHEKKAIHVKRTWGKRCNKLIFLSSAEDHELESVVLQVTEGRKNLWNKTIEAFKHVYKYHFDEYDWFFKADDDTFAILENLRHMLYAYNTNEPIYFGSRYKYFSKEGYMSGGSGYVLSREALKRFIEQALPDPKCYSSPNEAEDVNMGICLQNVDVIFGDTRDKLNRATFFPVRLSHHLVPHATSIILWYWEYLYYNDGWGLQSCADYAISFHHIPPKEMYQLEYYLYHLRRYGIEYRSVYLPPKKL